MRKERCWVWFRGGLNESSRWVGGFQATTDAEPGVLIQHPGYRDARVPSWRVTTVEPADSSSHQRVWMNPGHGNSFDAPHTAKWSQFMTEPCGNSC